MKYSAKGAAPAVFVAWLALKNEEWSPTYAALSGAPKEALVSALLEEQGHLCAYCGVRVGVGGLRYHIDHFWPQSHFNGGSPPDLTLDYNNLFISCGPLDGKDNSRTCGDHKSDWFDTVHYVIPSDPASELRFRYLASGDIEPSLLGDSGAENMITTLNLQDPSLAYQRRVLLEALELDISTGAISPLTKPDEIARWRTADVDGRCLSLSQVAARYLEDEPLI
jgi:uncharacterized protein (TIGR02646 family)